jgi:integrase
MGSIDPTKWEVDGEGRPRRDEAGRKVASRGTRWRARYRDRNGRSRSQPFDRKQDARNWLARNSADLQRGDWIDPKLRRACFDDWADAFEKGLVRLAPTTAEKYEEHLRLHIRPYFTRRPMAAVDYQEVEDFIAHLFRKGLGPKSIRNIVSVLSLVFKAALRGKVIRDNPAADHHVKVPRQSGQVLPMPELERLLAHVREEYRAAVVVLAYTGMRPSELCGLRVGRVSMLHRTVHVCETLTPTRTKGLVAGPTKSEQERLVVLPLFVFEILAAHLASRAERLGRSLAPDDYVFAVSTGRPLNAQYLRRHVIKPALAAAGLPPTFRTYDLRHCHASELIDMGASPLAIKERLGHADVLTTFRKYGHLFTGVQERLAAELEQRRQNLAASAEAEVVSLEKRRDGRGIEAGS